MLKMAFSRRILFSGNFACDLTVVAILLICLVSCPLGLVDGQDRQNTRAQIQPSSLLTEDSSLRTRRAPFRPPSITSFEPPVKKPKGGNPEPRDVVAPARETPDIFPQARRQLDGQELPEDPPSIVPLKGPPIQPLPSSPYASSKRRPIHKPLNPNDKVVLDLSFVQNDHDALEVIKKKQQFKKQKLVQTDSISRTGKAAEIHKEEIPNKYQMIKGKKVFQFRDLQSILSATKMTYKQLEQILKKNNKTMPGFLEFVERGVSLDEIFDFLKRDKGQKENFEWQKNWNSFEIKPRQNTKLLTDFDFTANVHDLDNYLWPLDEFPTEKPKKLSAKKDPFDDLFSENPKDSNINSLMKQKINSKQNYDIKDSLTLPAKDSPIISHFKSPVKKAKEMGAASIVSLTLEVKETTKPPKPESRSSTSPEQSRKSPFNKFHSKTSGVKLPSTNSKNYKQPPTKSEIVKNNMKFVFPMKPVLIFCAVLGGLAFLTILIFISYIALKCNKRKPSSKKFHVIQPTAVESIT